MVINHQVKIQFAGFECKRIVEIQRPDTNVYTPRFYRCVQTDYSGYHLVHNTALTYHYSL